MGGMCSSCYNEGCWWGCCPCLAKHISSGKCMSVVPWWPLMAILMFIIAGVFVLLGLELVTEVAGVDIDPVFIQATQAGGGVLILLNLIFAYSVLSNKLRIHNIHCMAETCRGYRIKDSSNPCVCLLRLVCKVYNLIISLLSWIAALLAITLAAVLCWLSGCTILVAALCDISHEAIQALMDELVNMQDDIDETPVSDYVTISNSTLAADVCKSKNDLTNGGMYLIICAPLLVLAQTIMLLSYHVVAEVSWRHMKDVRKEEERAAGGYDGQEMSGKKGAGGGMGPNYDQYASGKFQGGDGMGAGGGFQGGPPNFGGPTSPFERGQPSQFGMNQKYSQENI